MNILDVGGISALASKRDLRPRTVRIKFKKRKPLKELGFSKLNHKQKTALANFMASGCDPRKKKEAAVAAGYS